MRPMAMVLPVSQYGLHEGDTAGCPGRWLARCDAVMTHEPGTMYTGSESSIVCHVCLACCLGEAIDDMDTTERWSSRTVA